MPIVDQGGIREALRWLAERRLEQPSAPRLALIDEAARRFDLTPLDAEFLLRAWKDDSGADAPSPQNP